MQRNFMDEHKRVRELVDDLPLLIPGIGSQAGDLEQTIHAGRDSHEQGMIINSSRGVIFASRGEDFAQAARREVETLNRKICACL